MDVNFVSKAKNKFLPMEPILGRNYASTFKIEPFFHKNSKVKLKIKIILWTNKIMNLQTAIVNMGGWCNKLKPESLSDSIDIYGLTN